MMLVKPAAAILLLVPLLAACQPQTTAPAGGGSPTAPAPGGTGSPPAQADYCGAAKLGKFVGIADSAAQRAAVMAASGAKIIRWLTPGMAVTMDYRQDRLNANIAATGRYTGFSCG